MLASYFAKVVSASTNVPRRGTGDHKMENDMKDALPMSQETAPIFEVGERDFYAFQAVFQSKIFNIRSLGRLKVVSKCFEFLAKKPSSIPAMWDVTFTDHDNVLELFSSIQIPRSKIKIIRVPRGFMNFDGARVVFPALNEIRVLDTESEFEAIYFFDAPTLEQITKLYNRLVPASYNNWDSILNVCVVKDGLKDWISWCSQPVTRKRQAKFYYHYPQHEEIRWTANYFLPADCVRLTVELKWGKDKEVKINVWRNKMEGDFSEPGVFTEDYRGFEHRIVASKSDIPDSYQMHGVLPREAPAGPLLGDFGL